MTSMGRKVVLKPLEEDCLLRGRLHPSIAERLARVRDLAHPGVANLLGVERFRRDEDPSSGEGTFLVWDYVDGSPADEHMSAISSPAGFAMVAREIALAVESLHALGIVHGQVRPGNVIIDDRGRVWLTDVSPLLYDDPANDIHDTVAMLEGMMARRAEWRTTSVGRALARAFAEVPSLAHLRAMLAESNETGGDDGASGLVAAGDADTRDDRPFRRRALLGALLVAVAGAAIAASVVSVTTKRSPALPPPPEASTR